jgi:hypothetical protein
VRGPLVVVTITRLEKGPTGRSHDESIGDPHDGQSDAEKFKHIRADQQRAEQQEEAVDGDP